MRTIASLESRTNTTTLSGSIRRFVCLLRANVSSAPFDFATKTLPGCCLTLTCVNRRAHPAAWSFSDYTRARMAAGVAFSSMRCSAMNSPCFEGEENAHAGGLPVVRVAPVDLIEAVSQADGIG